jgi:hypothetical protein
LPFFQSVDALIHYTTTSLLMMIVKILTNNQTF